MRRYRSNRSNYRTENLDQLINSIKTPYQYTPNWAGDFRDAFAAPRISEPDYSQYRYISNLEVLADEMSYVRYFPPDLRVSEIEGVLSRTAIYSPFKLSEAVFSAPKLQCPKLPDPPNDPRPLLSAQQPKPTEFPTKQKPLEAKASKLSILGIKLRSMNSTITRGRQRENNEIYKRQLIKWQTEVDKVDDANFQAEQQFQLGLENEPIVKTYHEASSYWKIENEKLKLGFEAALYRWNSNLHAFIEASKFDKATIASLRADVEAGFSDAIQTTSLTALRNSRFQRFKSSSTYDSEAGILLVDYDLPNFSETEIVEDINFSSTQKAKAISARRFAELADTALYGLMLRAAYDFAVIFKTSLVRGIAINGWISRNDPATGKFRSDVTMSLFATKDQLIDLNIEECEPKIAYKSLKGSVGSNPQDYTPIQPIYQFNEQDERIVESREVLSSVGEFENLGAMHWEDFEHLIREVFEKEFATNGAKVNVTRASRDSGVDAIVFDPDPIRGGKIVIQAKRYVNTVDVSAVRDLFGTVQNEGANKGILITTSGFGPDSFEFAKGKPLTLMNGQNLLWLLEKHGRQFVIDLPSARKILKQRGWL